MLIVDAHLDLSMNALQWNRDLLRSVYTIRTTRVPIAAASIALSCVRSRSPSWPHSIAQTLRSVSTSEQSRIRPCKHSPSSTMDCWRS